MIHDRSGHEFYGLVISVFDADGKILIQQCTPSSLVKFCPSSVPAEKEQEPPRPGNNQE
jgi:hypothetical protein